MKKQDELRGFVFYPQDYFGDRLVRLMPGHLRIVWVECFLMMSESPRRGVLLKKNGNPYSVAELAQAMNVSTEDVELALQWVVREGVASVDRGTRAICNRRMMRDENKRKTNRKNGKSGGNPVLAKQRASATKPQSVNPPLKASDKAKPEPEPEPEPEPDKANTVDISSTLVWPDAEKRAGRKPDLAYEFFAQKHREKTGAAYVKTDADFVQLAKVRKANGVLNLEMPEAWAACVENFFDSPLGKITLADCCVRYPVFRNSPLNEFKNPIKHRGNGNGKESHDERVARRNREAAIEFDRELFGAAGNGDGPGSGERPKNALLPRPK